MHLQDTQTQGSESAGGLIPLQNLTLLACFGSDNRMWWGILLKVPSESSAIVVEDGKCSEEHPSWAKPS